MDTMKNESGLEPMEFNVLVKQDVVEEKTKGGLLIPEQVVDRERHGVTRGEITAISPMAFNADIWNGEPPAVGQRVAFARNSGSFIEGDDGQEYRLVKDKDILCMIGGANV